MGILNRILELAAKTVLVTEEVEPAVAEFRMSRCLQCDRRDETENRCRVCKCFLAAKTLSAENMNVRRRRAEITHCPLGRWDDLETANAYREIDGLPLLTK